MCSPDPELTINLVMEDDDEERLREREEALEEQEELLEDDYYNQYRTGAGLGSGSNPDFQGGGWSTPPGSGQKPPGSGYGRTTSPSPFGSGIKIRPRGRTKPGFQYRPRLTTGSGGSHSGGGKG